MPIGWVAAAGAAASLIGGAVQANAAQNAADTQANAAQNAQNLQQQQFNTVLGNEKPFVNAGTGAVNTLADMMGTSGNKGAKGYGSLNDPFTIDKFNSMSPAYKFQLQQGQQGVLNQDSSSKGAESGAALKDLASFNQGYANTAFNNAFNQYQTQQNNVFGRLSSLATLGQGAASNQATGASSFSNAIGQSATNVGSAQAAGQIGVGNAISGGLSNSLPWLMAGGSGSPNYTLGSTSSPGGTPYSAGTPYGSGANTGEYTNSDRLLKQNIEPYCFHGTIPIYKFHYIDEDETEPKHIGVIAQEVMQIRPDVVKRGTNGYLKVNYGKLGIPTPEQWAELDRVLHG